MCFPSLLPIKNVDKYNWAGDLIVNDPIVKSFRKVPESKKGYKMDVRDFIKAHGNALIDSELDKIQAFADKVKAYRKSRKANASSQFFRSKSVGAFDFRVNVIMGYLFERFTYEHKTKNDSWLLPEETLAIRKGDCEDFAFLLASLIISSGVSSYNVRVALGNVKIELQKDNYDSPKGHAWVMYKQENGIWKVLEPTIMSGRISKRSKPNPIVVPITATQQAVSITYEPEFVFNDDHLWIMKDTCEEYKVYSMQDIKEIFEDKLIERWNQLDVAFHGKIHKSIIDEVIGDPQNNFERFAELRNGFLLGKIDKIDADIGGYTPIEHFDNEYIAEGWAEVASNINRYLANTKDIFPLSKAVHAVADFYAHTTYEHFVIPDNNGVPPICDILELNANTDKIDFNEVKLKAITHGIDYLTDSIFKDKWNTFSINRGVFHDNDRITAIAGWKGKIISGRYAQVKEVSNRGGSFSDKTFESITNIPQELRDDALFFIKGALPHHNEIAIDSRTQESFHKLYVDGSYEKRFDNRRGLAVRHITEILKLL